MSKKKEKVDDHETDSDVFCSSRCADFFFRTGELAPCCGSATGISLCDDEFEEEED